MKPIKQFFWKLNSDFKDFQYLHHYNDQQLWQNKNIMSVLFLSLLLNFDLTQQAALVNFILFLNIFKILKFSFWTFWRKNCVSLDLLALFSRKPCKAFRIAQYKQRRLVKQCLNSDLYFLSKTPGTVLLKTIVAYKPPPSLSQENKKTFLSGLLDTTT